MGIMWTDNRHHKRALVCAVVGHKAHNDKHRLKAELMDATSSIYINRGALITQVCKLADSSNHERAIKLIGAIDSIGERLWFLAFRALLLFAFSLSCLGLAVAFVIDVATDVDVTYWAIAATMLCTAATYLVAAALSGVDKALTIKRGDQDGQASE